VSCWEHGLGEVVKMVVCRLQVGSSEWKAGMIVLEELKVHVIATRLQVGSVAI
jgi:hypothetical protein